MSVKISSLNTASTINSGDDINIAGNNPLAFSDWGGGWFMQDGTWIRSYNAKSLWMGAGLIGGDGGLTIGYGGGAPPSAGAIIAGSVGIGTNVPASLLHVGAATNFTITGRTSAVYASSDSETIFTIGRSGTNYPQLLDFGVNQSGLYSTISARQYTTTENKLILQPNGGNVGIGTTSPTRKFVVTGAANDEWIATFTNTGTNPYGVFIDTSANSGAAYSFATYTNAGTGFFVLNNGNVLIGTTTDVGSKLDVNGTARVSGATSINGTAIANTVLTLQESASLSGALGMANRNSTQTYRFAVDSAAVDDGNFCIINSITTTIPFLIAPSGAATFSSSVTVGGNSIITGSDRPLELRGAGGGANSLLRFSDGATAKFSTGFNGGNYIIYDDVNSTYRLTINGSTGAATFSSSVTATSFGGNAYPYNSILGSGADASTGTVFAGSTSGYASSMDIAGGGATNPNTIIFKTASIERVRIASNGNVGIGTTTPKSILEIVGNLSVTHTNGSSGYSEVLFYENNTLQADIFVNGTSNTNYAGANSMNIWQGSNAPIAFYTNGTNERMRIAAGGNLYIGHTDDYGARLSVKQPGSGNAANFSNGSDADLNIEITATGAVTKYAKLTPSVGIPLVLSTTTGSNVLIGTTTDAGYKLDVNGYGRFSGGVLLEANSTGVPLFYAKQTGSSGYTAIQFSGNNGTDIASFTTYNGDIFIGSWNGGNGSVGQLRINTTSGAAIFSSSVTATSLIKSGGTSSQYLMADGSVDSNAYALVNHTHDLGRYSLAAPGNIDGLTSTTFRTTLFGVNTNTWNLSTARWNTTPTVLPGMNAYGTMFAWSGSDTHGFIATDYSGANITVGGGNGNNINWTALLIHSLNIGSQSVSYATTAGALTSMLISQFTNDSGYITSASLAGYAPLDGTGATGLWGINISGISDLAANLYFYSLNTGSVNVNNGYSAVYRNENGNGGNVPYSPVLHIAASDTMWQIQGTYGATGNGTLYFRQGYSGSWGNWLTMISSANISSYLSGTYLPLTGGTLTGTLNGTRAVFSTAINNDYGLSVTNTGTTGAGGLHVNIGTSATGAPIRVDKAGVNIFLMSSTGNITTAGDLAVNGGDIIISSSGGANVFTRYQNGTGNVEWRLAASVFTLVDNVNEISLMEINPTTAGTFLYYPSLTINTSNTSGGVLLFKATLAANTWGIYKNDTTGLTITKNSVTQLGISATGEITLINTLSVTGGYIEVGAYGLSSSTYSAYIRRNDTSSYGAWDITGGKGGYTGALYNTTNLPHIMFGTTNGHGGLYYQTGSRWVLYYDYTNNCLAVGGATSSASYKLYVTGAIYATGAIVANSDGRNKENIEVVGNALDKVNNLRGVTYTKKNEDTGKREMGVIAQEVLPHVPEVVQYAEDLDQYGVSYGNFAGLFIEAIKEQQVLIKELQAEIEILKNK